LVYIILIKNQDKVGLYYFNWKSKIVLDLELGLELGLGLGLGLKLEFKLALLRLG